MLFSRRTRTLLPIAATLLDTTKAAEIKARLKESKCKQAVYYDRNAKEKPQLEIGQTVRAQIQDGNWKKAEVEKCLPFRSYVIRTEDGTTYRRNRRHVRISTESPIVFMYPDDEPVIAATPAAETAKRPTAVSTSDHGSARLDPPLKTRSGREIRKPARYRDQ